MEKIVTVKQAIASYENKIANAKIKQQQYMQKAVAAAKEASTVLGVDVTVDNYDEVIDRAANWQLWAAIDDSLTHVAEQERDEEYYLENLQLMQEKLEEGMITA